MISRNLYLNIIFRVILIIIFTLLLGYFFIEVRSIRLSIIFLVIIIVFTVSLIKYLNTTNRKISYFFNSVRNNDSTLTFPVEDKNKVVREIYLNMNRVNRQIQQLKIENRHQEQFFGILLEHLATGIITYNNKGFIQHANSSAKNLLSVEVLTHLQQIERIDQKLYHAITTIKPMERRLVAFNSARGEIQLSLKATSYKTNDDELMILSLQDIKNELDEKELDSWMKLIRVLMHEIMNSITPITSLSESLTLVISADGKPIMPENVTNKKIITMLQGLDVIKEQGKGLMSFVESYRKLTRIPEPERKLFKLGDLLNRVKILYDSIGDSSINLEVSLIDHDVEVFADQNLISQVLINLLKNAIEANENNPNLRITMSTGIDSDNHPEICISDNGIGIPEENLDEIFVPFFTTRKNGSGIGLSLSRQIMKMHGGNLNVRSIPGKETVFCLSFI
jgi:two-component system, NtrC family, nitrogen regulation sensor histidine kinase NtrY